MKGEGAHPRVPAAAVASPIERSSLFFLSLSEPEGRDRRSRPRTNIWVNRASYYQVKKHENERDVGATILFIARFAAARINGRLITVDVGRCAPEEDRDLSPPSFLHIPGERSSSWSTRYYRNVYALASDRLQHVLFEENPLRALAS